ncbi:MAG: molybdenum cofactor guanylyltransferase, partial [Pseudomonadota bacterium]|nr:molybdenum cofactor guanylyltransferase [Pseudomonadota bacterium]
MSSTLDRLHVTLGILAGGRATRLERRDKAWLQRAGIPQVVRLARHFEADCGAVLVSANAGLERYAALGLAVVSDRVSGIGPIGGLEALADACTTPWLLTLPVDVINIDSDVLCRLVAAAGMGSVAEDDDGPQPLVALYQVASLRAAIETGLMAGEHAIHAMQARL